MVSEVKTCLVSWVRQAFLNNRHGFRKWISCLTHLLKHLDNVIQKIVNGNEHDVVYLVFTKAFDELDREILLHKIKNLSIQGNLLEWITQFLTYRHQFVTMNVCHSVLKQVPSGAPQKSVLGPILFLIYTIMIFKTFWRIHLPEALQMTPDWANWYHVSKFSFYLNICNYNRRYNIIMRQCCNVPTFTIRLQ